MNTLKNVACLANALGLLCFWPYIAAVLLAVLIVANLKEGNRSCACEDRANVWYYCGTGAVTEGLRDVSEHEHAGEFREW
jgi:hypothetical protein